MQFFHLCISCKTHDMKTELTTKGVAAIAMLILLCFACNNRMKRNSTSYTYSQNKTPALKSADSNAPTLQTQDIILETPSYSKMPPSSKQKFTAPGIKRDEEISIENKEGIVDKSIASPIDN